MPKTGRAGSGTQQGSAAAPAEERYVFETADALKALADPLRLRFLLLAADRPRTVKEAAEILGVPATRLYYHVKILQRLGLIVVTDRNTVSGIEERTYGAVATSWTMSPSLAASAISTSGVLRALMNMVRSEIEAVLQERPDQPMGDDAQSPIPAIGLTRLALDDDEVAEVERRFGDLMDEFGAEHPEDTGGKPEFHMFFAVYPVPGSVGGRGSER